MKQFVFFPFTYMNREQCRALDCFFPETLYFSGSSKVPDTQPTADLIARQRLSPVLVPDSVVNPVQRRMEEFVQWGTYQKVGRHSLKMLMQANPYFQDDTQVTSIKAQLKSGKSPSKTVEKDSAAVSLDQHLLFLKMAHLFDQENDAIDSRLAELSQSQQDLFSELLGETGIKDHKASDPAFYRQDLRQQDSDQQDPGRVMTRERLLAWGACMNHFKPGGGPDGWPENPIFVTSSPAVFEYLESICSKGVNALDINEIKVHEKDCELRKEWQIRLGRILGETCAQDPGQIQGKPAADKIRQSLPGNDDGCQSAGLLRLSFFSGDEINTIFNLSDKQTAVCLVKLKA